MPYDRPIRIRIASPYFAIRVIFIPVYGDTLRKLYTNYTY